VFRRRKTKKRMLGGQVTPRQLGSRRDVGDPEREEPSGEHDRRQ
jgi:hypothetical protein